MWRASSLFALVLVVAACGSGAPSSGSQRPARLVNVSSVLPVRGAFNRDAGKTRLLVLLSPT
jgi:hypothetical protein